VKGRTFPAQYRLKLRREFSSFSRKNPSIRMNTLSAQWKENGLPVVRLGITMANRFGKAVERTTFRRRVREAFRISKLRHMQGIDLHIRVLAKGPNTFHDIQKLFAQVIQILEKEKSSLHGS